MSVLTKIGSVLRTFGAITADVLQMPFVASLLQGQPKVASGVATVTDALGSVTGILSLMESIFPTVNGVKGGPAKLQAATPIVGSIIQQWADSNLPGHNKVIVTPEELNARVQAWTSATADLMNCFVPHGNEDLMDTVYIDLYDSATASTLVQTFQAVMRTDGTINCFFPSNSILIGNSYWIAFRHRNTLQAWSASPILFSDRTEYDFTSAQNMTYGDNSIQIDNGQWAFFSGDISDAALGLVGLQDQVIESQDYGDMENAVYVTLTGYIPEDITGDGIVESSDYGLMENNVYFTRVIHRP